MLSGTTVVSGVDEILIGQQCTASLAGIPQNCTVTCNWTVTGNAYENWQNGTVTDTPNGDDGGSDYSNTAAPAWFWSDVTGPKTVVCNAAVTPQKGDPFSVFLTKQVQLVVPQWMTTLNVGVLQISGNYSNPPGPPELWFGPAQPSPTIFDGIQYSINVTTPQTFVVNGAAGSVQMAQLVTASNAIPGTRWHNSLYGQTVLDGAWPYCGDAGPADGSTLGAAQGGKTPWGDAPGFNVDAQFQEYTTNFQANTIIMYLPPPAATGGGGVIWVPLAEFNWGYTADIKQPANGWAAYVGNPGNVNTSGANFYRQVIEPVWTVSSPDGGPWTDQ